MPPPEGRKHRASGVIAGGERELFVPVIWSRRLRANLRKKSWASVSAAVILRLSFHFCYSSFTSRQCFIFVYRSRAAVNLYFNLQEAANPPMGLVASRQMVQSEVGSRAAVLFQGPRSCCISAGVLQCVVDSRVAVPFQGPGSCCTSVGVHQCVGDSVVIALESPGSSLLWVISPGKGGILWSPGQDALLWADARKCPWNWMQKIGLDKYIYVFSFVLSDYSFCFLLQVQIVQDFKFVRWDLGRKAMPWIYKKHRWGGYMSVWMFSVYCCCQEKSRIQGSCF
ncbi:uncharacterized protein LOC120322143 isoform X1 [Drosophila yakuba]|uniref:uncharacterized protein LOC120322143 isoform X1 n=1 Tax=Drosophila yakuba TaxID=7245 RepID=UPI001C89D8B6|nr:uncharacterized protein LOC120322143 isoform X1 [Drosophila yakuba]XP_043063146.1 uncharacterized protein LOC120322143 isoform X1 [Drosophila yakuba]XP_043063147.1 uncharacterized protein LOC120322143 isoform X1 [Drosophila yakuba]